MAHLLDDAPKAIAEFGFEGHATGDLQALLNTDSDHNMVVCTLCSCYPFSILGMSPAWYKQSKYRARSVREPRKAIQEFGVDLPESVAIHVWDSTAELRYIVIPQRPLGTDGWTEEQLASIVTRNSMIGTDQVQDSAAPDGRHAGCK